MDPERWNPVDKLLQSALDRPAAERDVFLRRACGADTVQRMVCQDQFWGLRNHIQGLAVQFQLGNMEPWV